MPNVFGASEGEKEEQNEPMMAFWLKLEFISG